MGRLVLVLAPVVALAVAAPASATTFCVADPACPAGGVTQPDLPTAAGAAATSGDADAIRLGAGEFGASAPVVLRGTDSLSGAGRGATVVLGELTVDAGVVRGLTVRMAPGQATGVTVRGGVVADVDVDGAASTRDDATGAAAEDGATVRGASIALATGTGVRATGRPTVEDARITAPTGARSGTGGIALRRTTIDATVGVDAPEGGAILDAVVLRATGTGVRLGAPDATGASGNAGARLGAASESTIVHTTIRGDGAADGIVLRAGCTGQGVAATVTTTVIAGVATALRRGSSCPQPDRAAQTRLTVTRSAFDPTRVAAAGPGAVSIEPPVTDAPVLDADGVPVAGSPLIDAADPAEPAGTDVRGLTRPADGDGDGAAVADLGAFEVQPAPSAAQVGVLGQADTGATPAAPTALRVRAIRYRANRPRRYQVRSVLAFPGGGAPEGAVTTLRARIGRTVVGKLTTTMDRRGHADFKLRLAKGVRPRRVTVQVRFAGTETLSAFTSRRVRLR